MLEYAVLLDDRAVMCFGRMRQDKGLHTLADTRLRRVWGTGRITILGYGCFFGCFAPHSTAQFILVACLGAHGSI